MNFGFLPLPLDFYKVERVSFNLMPLDFYKVERFCFKGFPRDFYKVERDLLSSLFHSTFAKSSEFFI